jgi:hypothetical protein
MVCLLRRGADKEVALYSKKVTGYTLRRSVGTLSGMGKEGVSDMMKWIIILMIAVLPVTVSAEDETVPGTDSGVSVETQSDPGIQETGRDADPPKEVDSADKAPSTRTDQTENNGVRFKSIDDLNKGGK